MMHSVQCNRGSFRRWRTENIERQGVWIYMWWMPVCVCKLVAKSNNKVLQKFSNCFKDVHVADAAESTYSNHTEMTDDRIIILFVQN